MSTDAPSSTVKMMPPLLRWGLCILGVAMVAGAAGLFYHPAKQSSVELDGSLKPLKVEVREIEPSTLSAALLGGGVILILFGANGLPLLRFSAAGIVAETHPVAEIAQKVLKENPELLQNSEPVRSGAESRSTPDEEGDGEEEPSESQSAAATIEQNGIKVKVYDLRSVPSRLLADSISKWPGGKPPATIDQFEFASKPEGRGNKSWTVKFGGFDPLVVTYGGNGKTREATVRFATK
ncbi:hypothetical protein [Xanthomonas perforans]|uniref:hypothetical protein n=1 Tax=Xanthomonas perforans TaxID=442694 RepID=UPI00119621BE|nr:hypothetical protein [Xanthomonas perforans]MDC9651020.1 hypothetical protein [Xanthomonas perforans]MDC9656482.1 hypothetical protein [Xanthomonas perforans]MDC9676606.1 hypothetical protein [Xanthomonas perforans]MDC9680479.1 hypothetical protein [Xanthomonas perforans]MDC9684695.1 hypothetical protein [Xanthomonas perforans]